MRALTIVGNRPQFIKAAPLSLALADAGIDEVSLHSGQHYDAAMSEVFYDELGLRQPTHSLDLRTADVDVLERGISDVVALERPDWVIVFGDTNTTLAGARAAVRAGVALAHIEAGLRSGDLAMPEERNRIEVDRLADLLLCPDDHSSRDPGSRGCPWDRDGGRGCDGGRCPSLRSAGEGALSLGRRSGLVPRRHRASRGQRRRSRG